MTTVYRDILELLKEELDFIEREDTDGLFVRHGKANQLSRTPSPVSTMVTHIALTRVTNATCSILSARKTGLRKSPVTSFL